MSTNAGIALSKLLILATVIISGCATQAPSVAFIRGGSPPKDDGLTYVLQPFRDAQIAKAKLIYPQAPEILHLAVESALVKSGKHVVTDGNGDIEITGVVTAYYMGSFGGPYTTVGLDLKAVEKKSGLVIWVANDIKNTRWKYDYEPTLLAYDVACELIAKVFEPGSKP